MRINGQVIENIGLIRVRPIGTTDRYTLIIHPPGRGGVLNDEGATMLEIDVDAAEVQRIARVAPHLLAMPRRGFPSGSGKAA